eukprot:Awhi_evm1s15025
MNYFTSSFCQSDQNQIVHVRAALELAFEDCKSLVNDAWTSWGDYTECSNTCKKGTQTRTRSCTNPAPAHGVLQCDGAAEETVSCNTQSCPVTALVPTQMPTARGLNINECTTNFMNDYTFSTLFVATLSVQNWVNTNDLSFTNFTFDCNPSLNVGQLYVIDAANEINWGVTYFTSFFCQSNQNQIAQVRAALELAFEDCESLLKVKGAWTPWGDYTECSKICETSTNKDLNLYESCSSPRRIAVRWCR